MSEQTTPEDVALVLPDTVPATQLEKDRIVNEDPKWNGMPIYISWNTQDSIDQGSRRDFFLVSLKRKFDISLLSLKQLEKLIIEISMWFQFIENMKKINVAYCGLQGANVSVKLEGYLKAQCFIFQIIL